MENRWRHSSGCIGFRSSHVEMKGFHFTDVSNMPTGGSIQSPKMLTGLGDIKQLPLRSNGCFSTAEKRGPHQNVLLPFSVFHLCISLGEQSNFELGIIQRPSSAVPSEPAGPAVSNMTSVQGHYIQQTKNSRKVDEKQSKHGEP
uniref:Uncharacterized protein n=1 Tax=Sphaerodactylus townsendi TaxID=933632 RepID=A0ACB8F069_9SAUR